MSQSGMKEFKDIFAPEPELVHLRRRVKELESSRNRDKDITGQISEAISELGRQVKSARPVAVKYKPEKPGKSPCTHVLHITDWHYGGVVEEDEVDGFNVYSPDIARARVEKLTQAILDKTSVQRGGYNVPSLHVIGTGDYCCFPAGTSITLANGTVKYIESVEPGDMVLSNPTPRAVVKRHARKATADDELVTVATTKTSGLTGTREHVVLCVPRERIETGWNPGGVRGIPFIVRDKQTVLSVDDIEERALGDIRPGDFLVSRAFRPTDGGDTLDIAAVTGLDLDVVGTRLLRRVRGRKPCVISTPSIVVDNDLLWLLGLYIAEGHAVNGRKGDINSAIYTLNIDERGLSDRVVSIIEDKFGYSPIVNEQPDHTTRTVHINNQIIATLLVKLCGRGSENKQVSEIIYRMSRSLLPLVGGWYDGDGGWNSRYRRLTGVTTSPGLARQMSMIMLTEGVSCGIRRDTSGRHMAVYRLGLSGVYAQTVGSYTVKYRDTRLSDTTYEDGMWVEDCYCHRVTSVHRKPAEGLLYDLSIEGQHYYHADGFVVHNSGDIHPELLATNAFPAPVQAVGCGYLIGGMLAAFAPHFDKISVDLVTLDNHGRMTLKNQAAQGGVNNWGYVVAEVARQHVRHLRNVTVSVHSKPSALVAVGPERYLAFHGHQIKGWAGKPYYGFDRRVAMEAVKRMGVPEQSFTKLLLGHFHHGMNGDNWLLGGSLSGTDAFDHSCGRHSRPHQTSWFVHPRHGEFDWTRWWL